MDNLYSVIFGLQKQASAQNNAVVYLIKKSVDNAGVNPDYTTIESVVQTLTRFVTKTIETREPNIGLILLCGSDCVSVTNPTLVVTEPFQDSPKHYFRITEASLTANDLDLKSQVPKVIEVVENEKDNYTNLVKNAVVKCDGLAPVAVKSELSDAKDVAIATLALMLQTSGVL